MGKRQSSQQGPKLLALLLLTLTLAYQNCSKIEFTPNSDSVASLSSENKYPSCGVNTTTRLTKILFLVDTSGSNVAATRNLGTSICLPSDSDYASCVPASDPYRNFRASTMQQFFDSYTTRQNFQFGLITFADNRPDDPSTTHVSGLFSISPSVMQTAIRGFTNYAVVTDNGGTPYLDALRAAADVIKNDPDRSSKAKPNYAVILLTDGMPTDFAFVSVYQYADPIGDLLAVAPGQVTLNTIYYGYQNDPNAKSLLQTMANQGAGKFATAANPTTGLALDNVIAVSNCQ